MAAWRPVVQQGDRPVAVDDHQVDPAVVVQVAGRDPAAHNRMREIGRDLGAAGSKRPCSRPRNNWGTWAMGVLNQGWSSV